ncbi:unnamed protein product [Adineta steineri]|uniref:Uncharacterized protein n=1 Tax=Adineta steineri TaxID=433720 RepID=A0A814U6G6_9BILA|nr:unnamed protein product [Adineta steineri]CAF4173754.1 unnamed protein product [Adineta steineri]
MASILFIYLCFLILISATTQHKCLQYYSVFVGFDEIFDTIPSECSERYENNDCYSEIGYDYVSILIHMKFGERSINDSSPTPDNYYLSQETEMWHDTASVQWTVLKHQCYHGDLCDFEYAKMKVSQMHPTIIQCFTTNNQIIKCDENIKSCSLAIDNVFSNKTHQGCSSHSDDLLRKQLGIKEETSYYLNGKTDVRQSSVEYVCNHELCNGHNTYKKVIQLLIEYNLIRNDTTIGPDFSTANIKKSSYIIPLFMLSCFYFLF